ncbi:MAG: ribosome small subunit-dependent GTPase A [Candidatus Caenarcaniphilales bacterium]|nr:ribosome small subunit-dependent GTPase A [Candidatus Caenarcaniphilales bacterium]
MESILHKLIKELPSKENHGLIKRIFGHFYYVSAFDGSLEELTPLTLPTRLQKQGTDCLVGDVVEFDAQNKVIKAVIQRKSQLLRPKVANVDRALIVVSTTQPQLEADYLDRLLCQATLSLPQKPIVCLTKIDLQHEPDWLSIYKDLGIELVQISNPKGIGLDELKSKLLSYTSVLAGQSGVGKSSLLQSLFPTKEFKVGEVSQKINRGTHTTRHIEIFEGRFHEQSFYILDAPGFSRLEANFTPLELARSNGFPEIERKKEDCKFLDCLHLDEEGCAVQFCDSRKKSYRKIMEEAEKYEKSEQETNTKERRESNKTDAEMTLPKLRASQRAISRKRRKQDYNLKDELENDLEDDLGDDLESDDEQN